VTMPRSLPGVRTVTLKGGLSERPLNTLTRTLARLRLTDTPAKKRWLGKAIKAAMPVLGRLGAVEEPCSAIRVDVSGRVGAERRTVSYGAAGHMAALTGLPLAIGVRMLARGEIVAPGVHAPEAVVPPARFLAAVVARGITIYEMASDRPLELAEGADVASPGRR
jgi:saccharopine dehydrogenase-like NADP-dependent oxidoreductase